jgi:hypothetical protein
MTFGFRHAAALVAICFASQTARADLIIEEIVDATLTGGQPKWVEVKNIGTDCVYLGNYEICNYNNGGSTPSGCTNLSGVFLDAGASFVFAYESASNTGCSTAMTCFEFVYGTPPDQNGGPFINGDDAVAIRDAGTSSIQDVYGVIGVDGSGTSWEYLDSWARRNSSVTAASAGFVGAQWTYGGANVLDGALPSEILAATSPGTYATCVPAITNYCTSGTSTSGCNALIGGSGLPSASATSGFFLTASGVEGNKNGTFFFGTTGQQVSPWGFSGSKMCVMAPRYRTGLLLGVGTPGACDGSFSLDLNALWCATCPKPLKNPGPGVECNAQLWYRDPFNTGAPDSSMSNGLSFTTSL